MNSSITTPTSHPSQSTDLLQELNVVVVQYKGSNDHYRSSQSRLLEVFDQAGQNGAHVVVAPECACSNYIFSDMHEAHTQ